MANEMRDRLVELIEDDYFPSSEDLADHLIANGVVAIDTNVVSPENRPLITHLAEMPLDDVIERIKADVVPVVRCKNCIHYKDEWCEILKAESPVEDGFCCYGERKVENGK